MARLFNHVAAAVFVVTGAFGLALHAQPLMQPNISAAQARQIVDAVIAECGQPGDLLTVRP